MSFKDITINQQTKTRIAGKLLGLEQGDRLPTIIQLIDELNVSRGTIQNVFSQLADAKAIETESRGHMGTYLINKDNEKLLHEASVNSIYFSMPIPYSKKNEGMASGIHSELVQLLVPTGIFFISGSLKRLNSLLEKRVDAAVMSRYAADNYISEGSPVEIVHTFRDYSYVSNHCLITREGFDVNEHDSVKVGIDFSSSDQNKWVERLFSGKHIFEMPVQYMHIVERIIDNTIDASIWNTEEAYMHQGIKVQELTLEDEKGNVDLRNTQACIVVRKGDEGICNYIKSAIDFDNIARIQALVLSGNILPEY